MDGAVPAFAQEGYLRGTDHPRTCLCIYTHGIWSAGSSWSGVFANAQSPASRALSIPQPCFPAAPIPSLPLARPLTKPTADTPQQEVAKKRTRRTVKQQRGIVGASLDVIKERRSQRPEARVAARQQAIAAGKAKKTESESKKKMDKAKGAAKTAGTAAARGTQVSKQGAKGAPIKVQAKTR